MARWIRDYARHLATTAGATGPGRPGAATPAPLTVTPEMSAAARAAADRPPMPRPGAARPRPAGAVMVDNRVIEGQVVEAAEEGPASFTERVAARAELLFAELNRVAATQPPGQRATPAAVWALAYKAAKDEVTREVARERARRVAARVAASARSELSSVVHRNRRQLVPWLLAAPYAAGGELAAAAALHAHHPGGAAALCAAAAATGTVIGHRRAARRLTKGLAAEFAPRLQAGMWTAAGWVAAMPLLGTTGTGQAGMWLALLGGTAWMGLPWWRRWDHPIPAAELPEPDALPAPAAATAVDTEQDEDVAGLAARIIADWDTYVAGKGTLPGSTLSRPRPVEHGIAFQLHLVRGKQLISDVRTARPKIAAALDVDLEEIGVDDGPDHATPILTVLVREVANAYTGPRIIRDGEEVFIEIGPYADGDGCERFHALSGQLSAAQLAAGEVPRGSMHGGFALGTKGSGKSRLVEAIAVGLRALGIEVWYLDPQEGKSSPALMAEADWPLSGMHGSGGGAYGNVVDLWKAVRQVNRLRSTEGASAGHQGFQHTRERPAIMAIVEECHGVFGAMNPETNKSFGEDFADLDREMRKNGIGLLGVSQSITYDTFGRGNKASVLRDGMCATNCYLLSYGGKNLSLAANYAGQPAGELPTNRGYGFNTQGERPHTKFQASYTPDYQPWLAQYPKSTLDPRAQKVIGPTYRDRFTRLQADRDAAVAWLTALDDSTGDTVPPAPGHTAPSPAPAATTTSGAAAPTPAPTPAAGRAASPADASLLSPQQLRLIAAANNQLPTADETGGAGAGIGGLTETELRVLVMVHACPQTPTTLAEQLGISPQAAGKHLRNLATKNAAIRDAAGRYTPNPSFPV